MTCCRARYKNRIQRLQYTDTNYDEVKQLCGDKVLAPFFCMGFSMLSVDQEIPRMMAGLLFKHKSLYL